MDFQKLGLKVGLEIHQQLKSSKLFCRCPSILRTDAPDIRLERRHRPVASEVGTLDPAALHEFLKGSAYLYEAYKDSTCLVEVDEEPPHPINVEALATAIEIAKGLNASIFGELHIMRKAIIDGSCPSGFQRTLLFAIDGAVKVADRQIHVDTIALEEDAARIISKSNKISVFRLDRQGIPLIEIATAPELHTPEEAKAGAEAIGLLLRSTGKVMRGLGTIRQDLNISIADGQRIEIKGVQRLDLIPLFVTNEVERQQALVELAKQLAKKPHEFGKIEEVTEVFSNTACKIISGEVYAVKLAGLAGLMKHQLHAGLHFGKEASEYAKIKAGVKGFFHTDEMPNYGVTEAEVDLLRKKLGATEKDLIAFVSAPKEQAYTALEAVVERCKLAFVGVPKETRQAKEDGSSSFLRPLGSAARMYPETDLLTIPLSENFTKSIHPPEPVEKQLAKLEALGLNKTLAKAVMLSERKESFDHAIKKGVKATIAATVLEEAMPYLGRQGVAVDAIADTNLNRMFDLMADKKLTKEMVPDALSLMAKGEPVDSLAADILTDEELKRELKQLIAENKGYIESKGAAAASGLMGVAMKKFRGKADGQAISKMLRELLSV